jgi:hypothetical protein
LLDFDSLLRRPFLDLLLSPSSSSSSPSFSMEEKRSALSLAGFALVRLDDDVSETPASLSVLVDIHAARSGEMEASLPCFVPVFFLAGADAACRVFGVGDDVPMSERRDPNLPFFPLPVPIHRLETEEENGRTGSNTKAAVLVGIIVIAASTSAVDNNRMAPFRCFCSLQIVMIDSMSE